MGTPQGGKRTLSAGTSSLHYKGLPNFALVRGHAMQLPFGDGSFDLVVNVEASHAYSSDAAFLLEVRRVLHPQGRFLYADYRTRWPCQDELARSVGCR